VKGAEVNRGHWGSGVISKSEQKIVVYRDGDQYDDIDGGCRVDAHLTMKDGMYLFGISLCGQ